MSEPVSGKSGILCSGCGQSFPSEGFHFRCPRCGSLYELSQPLPYAPQEGPNISGLSRFRFSFPISDATKFLSLGAGGTPLVPFPFMGREVHLKCEYANPSGSFKDRGTAVLVSAIQERRIIEVVEDSSGNAGTSLAAYAAAYGIRARIYIPGYASGPKRAQIESYGAQVIPVPGTRADVSKAVYEEAQEGAAYASHAYLPHGLAGMATIAFELYEQLGQPPGAVLTPIGQGTLLLGLAYGFRALKEAGKTDTLPRLVGVQAANCAPIWEAFHGRQSDSSARVAGTTLAEGICIVRPLRGEKVVHEIRESGGEVVKVSEDAIRRGKTELGRKGIHVEPTSAVIWDGIRQVLDQLPDPVVAILSGSGYKSLD